MRTRLRGKEVVATNKPGMQKAYKPYVKPRIDTHFHQDKTEVVTTPSPPELSATQKMQLKELVLENEKRKILQKKEDEEFLRQAAIKADLERKKLEDETQALKIAEEERIRAEQNNEGITDSIQTPDKEGSPAHAGIVPAAIEAEIGRNWFPRTRGDSPTDIKMMDYFHKVPPHTRG